MRGYLYTLEVALAIMLILVTFIPLFSNPPSKPELETSIIKQAGFDALDFLRKEGLLREIVANNSEAGLESRLSAAISKNTALEAEICSSYCDSTGVPVNRTVIGIDYYVSSFNEMYMGKRVHLWLWKK